MIKMLNLDNLFNLFPPEDVKENNEVSIDFTTTPVYFLGMWKKIILNHINFNKKILSFFKKANNEFDIRDVAEAGKYVTFGRAWFYLKKLNLDNEEHVKAIQNYSDEYLNTSLELGIQHFQEKEEYEKCAQILKVLKISQES